MKKPKRGGGLESRHAGPSTVGRGFTVTWVKVGVRSSKERLGESEAPLAVLDLSPLYPDSVRLQPAPPRGPKSHPV